MTAQIQTSDRVKTSFQSAVSCLTVGVSVLKQHVEISAKWTGRVFWKHAEEMGKSNNNRFDGIL